ncbi:MAG: aromatic amino acid lyase, partial [Meiothermus sp.]|nr:aromatic amino acid lyase [Meiothermus sp.]
MLELDQELTLADFHRVVRAQGPVGLSQAARARLMRCRAFVEELVEQDAPVYGLNTGFGKLASVRIAAGDLKLLQRNLLLSHAIGVGEPFPGEVVRGMLLLRAQSLALGYSGVRVEVVERLLWFLNQDILPVVPSQGSVGASGDLAPLAHMCLPLIGEGEVLHKGRVRPAGEVLREYGVAPLEL